MLTITTADFTRLAAFVQKHYGINLTQKKQLIESRLANTLPGMGFSDFTGFVNYVIHEKNNAAIEIMLNKLTTNYTYFMREEAHFSFLQKEILPFLASIKKNKSINIWSAGCATGEEPYTISMILFDFFGSELHQWDTRILATDISQRALAAAQEGIFPEQSVKNVPKEWLNRYFTASTGKPGLQVSQKVKDNVIFRSFNLMEPISFRSSFDVIFCRNVMIYFDQPTKNALVNRFYNATNSGGYLLIGHSETLNRNVTPYHYIMPATYQKRD